MNKFIEKLDIIADVNKLLEDLKRVEDLVGWPEQKIVDGDRVYHANQIGLTYRKGSAYPWYDASGSLYDQDKKHFTGKESDFTEWNDIGDYTKSVINQLKEKYGINFGRIRYMKLLPKVGLSVHPDFEPRYHIVLKTNPYAFFGLAEPDGDTVARCYHIPADGNFYKVNTLQNHFVFNGGWEPRIHLVLAEAR